ncbi:MAG TPA: NAD(P)-binding domain-containing protein [Roseiflexaceae bacterium]|nr:NAD(P)-binding domain-containing protein [Roseiflexaceae bacterium]
MKVAVLGIGNIGGTLSRKWARAGHEVMCGVRDVQSPKAQAFLASGEANLAIDTLDRAIAFGEVVVFAVPGSTVEAIVSAQAPALAGKIIIDATNNMRADALSSLAVFAARTPTSKVFRAFNYLGWENFAEPHFGDLQADLLYCGPDEPQARQAVEGLIADIGLRPLRLGDADHAHLLDALLRVWFALATEQHMGRHLAFKVLTPSDASR